MCMNYAPLRVQLICHVNHMHVTITKLTTFFRKKSLRYNVLVLTSCSKRFGGKVQRESNRSPLSHPFLASVGRMNWAEENEQEKRKKRQQIGTSLPSRHVRRRWPVTNRNVSDGMAWQTSGEQGLCNSVTERKRRGEKASNLTRCSRGLGPF